MADAAGAGKGGLRGEEGPRHLAHLDEVAGLEAAALDRVGPARRLSAKREITPT